MKVAKAEWPASSMVPDGSTRKASPPQGEPSSPSTSAPGDGPLGPLILQRGVSTDLQPDTEVPTLVGPLLPAPEREKTGTQRSQDADLPPASKSWSWAALEGPAPTGQPEGVSRRKGE